MRISELADQAGVSVSTVRYYERIGLLAGPPRTDSGYRSYDAAAANRLQFVTRAKRIGFSLDQISGLLSAWDGVHCATTHEEVGRLVESKRVEVVESIRELERFVEQLDHVRETLARTPPAETCLPDLSCCVPATADGAVEFVDRPVRRVTPRP
jgi:MerR family transcriptional regulator, copper efflux regulator